MEQNQKPKRRRIEFSLSAPHSESVYLAGDFNDWDDRNHPMKRYKTGVWKKILMLQPGRYEYRFVIDGVWSNDAQNPATCPNSYGTLNNVRVVEALSSPDTLKPGRARHEKRKTKKIRRR